MRALITAAIYIVPFLVIAIATKRWLDRRNVALSDVEAEGNPRRRRPVFLLGIWRDGRD
jgi:hypothetical protein